MAEQGYGKDTYCWDRLVTGRTVTGPELVAQALYRRLTTPRGTLRDGDDGNVYGLDLPGFIGRVGNAASVAAIPDLVRAEVLKDDRVLDVAIAASSVTGTDGLVSVTLALDVELVNDGDRFQLTLSVGDVGVSLLGFSEAA
jgi:hypothetical protein